MSFAYITNKKIQTGICLWQNHLLATTIQQSKNNITILQVSQKIITDNTSIDLSLLEMKHQLKKGKCIIAINTSNFIIRHLRFEQKFQNKELLNYLTINASEIFGHRAEQLGIDHTPMRLLENTQKFHFNAIAALKKTITLWSTAFKKSKLNLSAIDIFPFAFYRILTKLIHKNEIVSFIILTSSQLQIYVFCSDLLLYDRCESIVSQSPQAFLPICSRVLHYYQGLDEMPSITQIVIISEYPVDVDLLHEKINIPIHLFHIHDLMIALPSHIQSEIKQLPILGFYCSLGCALWRTQNEH